MSEKINPVIVEATRGNTVETQFRGAVSVVDVLGGDLFSLGDIDRFTYPRSALKLFQVLPLIMLGAADHFGFTDQEIAVMCGSHNAEMRHLETVQHILNKIGLYPEDLGCGAHKPLSEAETAALWVAQRAPTAMHNNCSGKHAGFLALARFLNAPLEGYLEPDHPVQQHIRKIVAKMCEIPESELQLGIDGCSAPNYAMPLRNLAKGFVNLVCAHPKDVLLDKACRRVVMAVTTFPFMVAGTKRYCTDLMVAAEGRVLAKLGADGIYAMASPDYKVGIAIKIDDGSTGPQYNVAQHLLEKMHLLPESAKATLSKYRDTPIINCNKYTVGHRYPVEKLFESVPNITGK